MIGDIIRLYKIGKELGLTKKEINKVFLFDKSKRPIFYNFLLFLALFLFLMFTMFFVVMTRSWVNDNTYPSGALYSTIKVKDFRKRTKNLFKL